MEEVISQLHKWVALTYKGRYRAARAAKKVQSIKYLGQVNLCVSRSP